MARKKLTPKQAAFVREYLVDLNATQAAIRAGYSKKTARVTGPENLSKPAVAASIQDEMLKRATRLGITADEVLRELSILACSDGMRHFEIDPDTGEVSLSEHAPPGMSRAVSSIEVNTYREDGERVRTQTKFKLWDKPKALHLLAQHLGMLIHRIGGPDGEALKVRATIVQYPVTKRDEPGEGET